MVNCCEGSCEVSSDSVEGVDSATAKLVGHHSDASVDAVVVLDALAVVH